MDYGDAPDTNLKPSTGGSKTKHVSFTEVVSIVNSDHDCGSRPHSETNPKGIGDGSAQLSNSSSAVLSTSSRSSSDDPVLPNFRVHNYIPKPKSLYKNDKLNLSSEALNKLEESISGSQESTSQCSDITHESNSCVSPTLSPPIQVMDRAGGFDPDRIPDSIFSRPLSTPPDWSAASNDSLFSIRIGNTSFPREYTPRMGSDFCKSGELPKSGEASKSGELCQSGEPFEARESCESGEPHKSKELPQSGALNKSKESHHSREHSDLKRSGELARCRTYPPTKGVETDKKLDMAKTVHEDIKPGERGLIDGPANDVPKALMNNQVERKVRGSRDSSSANRHSDKSEISNPSCALPTKKKSSCLLCHFPDCCHCPDCCRVSCCCKCAFPGQAAVASVCPGQAAAVSAQPGLAAHAVRAQPGLAVHAVRAQPGLAVHANAQAVHGHVATFGSVNQKDPLVIPLPLCRVGE
ncbi:hypothetical protein Salat_1308900 [Sesamum alatum]|uniref:Uncharacterized protein n=1 Tax=Sesamum alatum TaxID=300844 RepID=A0AAE2CPW3_9LAMI|nr:hypothetical protein Salat_1308900 [Sesamum alatum]